MPRLPQRRLTTGLQIVSLAAAAWFVWANSIVPRLGHASLGSLLSQILAYFTLTAVTSVAITLLAYLVVRRTGLHAPELRLIDTAAVAVWFAPAMIVASAFSPASLGASLVLVISTTRLLVAQWTSATARRRSSGFTPGRVLAWRVVIAILASAAIHGGIFLLSAGIRLPAAGLFALAASLLTVLAIVTGAHTPRTAAELPNATLAVVLTLILAAGITMIRYGRGSGGPGDGRGSAPQDAQSQPDPRLPADGNLPGVILLAQRRPQTKLVAPRPARGKATDASPIRIPFTGEYWLFRAPLRRPPVASLERPGSPLDLSFSTTDGWPLLMEARQRLQSPLAVGCCGNVKIAVQSRDLAPGSAWLELSLLDTERHAFPGVWLGRAALSAGGREVLEFQIPAAAAGGQFDELKVAFHHASQVNRSVKIEIEGFTLVPREL